MTTRYRGDARRDGWRLAATVLTWAAIVGCGTDPEETFAAALEHAAAVDREAALQAIEEYTTREPEGLLPGTSQQTWQVLVSLRAARSQELAPLWALRDLAEQRGLHEDIHRLLQQATNVMVPDPLGRPPVTHTSSEADTAIVAWNARVDEALSLLRTAQFWFSSAELPAADRLAGLRITDYEIFGAVHDLSEAEVYAFFRIDCRDF
ncbi:MAG: hypothetical protein ACT4PU_08405 [Planctomycetota bacterium]